MTIEAKKTFFGIPITSKPLAVGSELALDHYVDYPFERLFDMPRAFEFKVTVDSPAEITVVGPFIRQVMGYSNIKFEAQSAIPGLKTKVIYKP